MSNSVLLVDDEESIRELFREYLGEDGILVKTALGAKESIELVKKERFELLLIDLIMPETGGLELLHDIRALGIDTPAVLLTAYDIEFDSARKEEMKIAGIIPKGAPMSEIVEKIKVLLKGR